MNERHFNFYDIHVCVKSDCASLLERLEKDFSYFLQEGHSPSSIVLHAMLSAIPLGRIPARRPVWKRSRCTTYDEGPIRTNDYNGEALVTYNYETNHAELFSENLHRLHELSYLLILSRTGKMLDLRGIHKLHAFGVQLNTVTLIGTMPMKGGKTTLFMNLIRDPEMRILSDDTPLITSDGRVLPFPIRFGLEEAPSHPSIDRTQLYELERKEYGKKILVPLTAVKNSIATTTTTLLLFKAKRVPTSCCEIRACSRLSLLPTLFVNLIVGLGLPILFEYFWETGPRDFGRKTKIALSRTRASVMLLLRARTLYVKLGTDRERNARDLQTFMADFNKTA